ncbi:MAG: hypothetical protein R3B90_14250 [Planctomycetaceae bacterium]
MSMMRRDGTKTVVDHTGPEVFWDAVEDHFTDNDRYWKLLAMLALRENAGWTVERIGKAFGHARGHVTRCLEQIKQELRLRFQEPEWGNAPEDFVRDRHRNAPPDNEP